MSRKKIIIVVALLVVIFGVWAYRVYKNSGTTPAGEHKSILGSLFPFGSNTIPNEGTGTTTTGTGTTGEEGVPTETFPEKRLTRISNKVVAGATVLPPPKDEIPEYSAEDPSGAPIATSKTPVVRFVEKGTGYVYDVDVTGQNGKKTSGTVVSRTAEALFGDDGTTILFRYVKTDNQTIATYLAHMVAPTATTSDGTIKGEFLPDNIQQITFSTDGKNILFLIPTGNGTAGISMKSDGTGKKQLFSSAFSEWLIDWTSGTPVLTTKAAASEKGYVYSVPKNGLFQKILGGVTGLTTKISPDGKNMLYSISGGNGLDMHIKRLSDGNDINTGLQTLPEKCLWSLDSKTIYCASSNTLTRAPYPDSWYQGLTHFNDDFWSISAETGIMQNISDGEGNNLDAVNLSVDTTQSYLVFINKNDGSLWSLALKDQ